MKKLTLISATAIAILAMGGCVHTLMAQEYATALLRSSRIRTAEPPKSDKAAEDGSAKDSVPTTETQFTWNLPQAGGVYMATGGSMQRMKAGTGVNQPVYAGYRGKGAGNGKRSLNSPVSLAVMASSDSITVGGFQQFYAIGTYSDGSTQDLTLAVSWSSSATSIATVSLSGLVTGISEGNVFIQINYGNLSASRAIAVTAAQITLTSLLVTPSSASLAQGSSQQLTAVGTYSDGFTKTFSSNMAWVSSNSAVASVSSGGLVTAISPGSATISATSGTTKASATITVTAPALQSITVAPASASILVGGTKQYSATGRYSDGSSKSLTNVTWATSAPSVTSISSSGMATGLASGTATISAVSGGFTGSAAITVSAPILQSLNISPASTSITVGGTQQFTATGTYSDGSSKSLSEVVWSSGNTATATISGSGVATGVGTGSTSIVGASGSVSASAAITVTSSTPTLQSIVVSPASTSINTGGTEQFTVIGTYSDGSTKAQSSANWTSSNSSVATVSSSGLAKGIGQGSTTITASIDSLSGSSMLSVTGVSGVGGCDGLGNCYIYASAKGSGNGSSWANAYTGFGTGTGQVNPAKMQRGATYWIANGSYGAQNFSTPDSGTQMITIEGATAASHGPATDWSDSYAGKAIFAGATTGIFSDYWAFEGQTRGSDWQSGYTIMFDINGVANQRGVITNRDASGTAYSNLFFDYVEVRGSNMNFTFNSGSSSNCSTYCDGGFYTGSPTNNLYVGHSWIHDVGDTQFQSNLNDSPTNSNGSGWIVEYNYISRDHTGDQANGAHSEAFSSTVQNMTVRYNYFQDILSSGVITDASGGNPDVGPWYVYGNIVFWTDNAVMTSNSTASGLGDGFVSFFGGNLHGTSYIVHNTIANLGVQPHCAEQGVACTMYYLYASGTGTASWVIENNLVWNANGSCVYDGGSTWTWTADYNTHYGGTAGTMQNCGSHAQTVANTNPFVSWDGSGTQLVPYESLNFSITTDTNAGNNIFSSLPAGCTPGVNCMNVDMNGKIFGANANYDRGALQK
ncbi:MAG: Ig-like domain-containing protein [Acidobacteriota bacterium]|nr:Ig-like domain-containing protein [Acidobacteriota bacterium]